MKYYATKLSENIHITPEGFLLCKDVKIARTGEMEYGPGETPLEVGDNGKVIISREESEVFRPETLASFEGKSFTVKHPKDFVTAENWKELTHGVLQNIRRGEGEDSDSVLADILVTDAKAIELVKAGMREVSCGYEAEYEQTGKGRGRQFNIVGNHCALVEEGRAGSEFAIKDHKTKEGKKMKLNEKFQALLAKFTDEAKKVVDEELKKDEPKKEEKKEESKDAGAYDELMKICKDLGNKLEEMKKGKDAEKPAEEKKDEPKKDEPAKDEPEAKSVEERLKALEEMVSKIMAAESGDEDKEDDDVEDADEDESEDDDVEESPGITGDEKSRVEILVPGFKAHGKDFKAETLKAFAKTKEGEKVIKQLTGDKGLTTDSKNVDTIFIAAAEMVKASRKGSLANTKRVGDQRFDGPAEPVTAEKMNELNAKKYNLN